MNRELTLLGGIGLGAALMYILDPDRGGRRRALVRDQLASAANKTPDAISVTARDFSNRARGLVAEIGSMFTGEEVRDDVLVARVRSRLGRFVSHPGAIEVAASQGRVALSGPILADEVDGLLSCVSAVGGVAGVENRLEVHEEAGNVPGLQGGRPRPGSRFELMQQNWSPTARLLAGAAGGALLVYGLGRGFPASCILGTVGAGLLARGVTNTEMKRLLGMGGSAVDARA